MIASPEFRWYVAQTHPHAENKAVTHLARQGFKSYLPKYHKCRRHARRIEMVVAPLFPRYVFVAIDMSTQRWRSINATIGISGLVCCGEYPAPVEDDIIAQLRRSEDEAGFIQLDARPRFAPGDRVRVAAGAFADCLGLYEGMTDHERITILLDLLGRKVRVTLDAELIEAA